MTNRAARQTYGARISGLNDTHESFHPRMHGKARPPVLVLLLLRDALTFDYENDDEGEDEAKVRGKDEEQKKINRLLYN
jgi:hypothetical protein